MEDPHNIAAFGAFLVAREVVSTTLSKHMTSIRKVLVWRASLPMDVDHRAKLQAAIAWLDVLHKQCHNAALPSTARLQQTKLPHAREVMSFQVQVEKLASMLQAEDITVYGSLHRKQTAKATQDAALLSMLVGYLPPIRLSCARTCLHPDHVVEGGCMDEECR